MMQRYHVLLLFLILNFSIWLTIFQSPSSSDLEIEPANLEVKFESISSILRTQLVSIYSQDNLIYIGDSVGALTLWQYDEKKKKLQFLDISRPVTPLLPPINPVLDITTNKQGSLVLTSDGKITEYLIDQNKKITGKSDLESSEIFKQIQMISNHNQSITIFAALTKNSSSLCIYQIKSAVDSSIPIEKIVCNSTTNITYSGLSYDRNKNLLSVGDANRVIIFSVNLNEEKTEEKLKYQCVGYLPKAEAQGFSSMFANDGTLIAINDIWVCSLVIDLSIPSVKVLSADRTEKFIKRGDTTNLAVSRQQNKPANIIINSKNKLEGYTLGTNKKLSYNTDSRIIGSPKSFFLGSHTNLFAVLSNQVIALDVGNEDNFLKIADSESINSDNHFRTVLQFGYWNSTLVTTSDGGENNFKIWNLDSQTFKMTLLDQRTFGFFSLAKSGPLGLKSILMMPPTSKSENANSTLHISVAGNDPFNVIIVTLNSQRKIASVFKSTSQHFNNITSLFMSADGKTLVTSSVDTLIKIWTLSENRQQIQDNLTATVQTKNGGILHGVQDSSRTYYVYAHANSNLSKLANITIWKLDPKKGAVKVGENVPLEAHQENITALLLSQDQKYIISLSSSGEMRLWRHMEWTTVDLLASLSLGTSDATITATKTNRVFVESPKYFITYSFDFFGFVEVGRSSKQFQTISNSSKIIDNIYLSGAGDGSIRLYNLIE